MIILIGKTSAGKDKTRDELVKLGYTPVVTYTTRPPRDGEVDGVTYNFISKEEFLQKESEGFFAETTSYKVASEDTWYYGSAIEDLTEDKIMIANPDGVKKLKKLSSINPVVFYILANEETIWNRLRQRGDDNAEARRRLNADDIDFSGINDYVDFSIRSDIGLTPKQIAELIIHIYKEVGEEQLKS